MTVSQRLLTHVGLGAAFVIAVVTVVTYALVYQALKQRDLRHLDTYIAERALREEARFQQVQSNLMLVRGEYLKRLEMPMSPEYVERQFDHWYRRYDDGAWRSREEFGDARKTSSMWADQEWECTPEQRRQVVLAQELCDEMLPGWVDTFPSYYFQFPKPGIVNVGVDVLLADWSWKMPGHYDTAGLEWIAAALPDGVPPDAFTWTGLQADDVVSEPLVCVYLPMVKEGVFLGSVGHNMNMSRMLDEATKSSVTGVSHFILRRDGRLMAHPTKRTEILAGKGLLTAQDCGDPALASLYRLCVGQTDRRFSGFDTTSDAYYSVARLVGPEWFYITTISQAHLQRQAFVSAQLVLWSGLVSFALVLVFLALILRTQIARPLAGLTRATKAMSAGVAAVPLPSTRADELGELASSFREMVAQVAAREGDLRELNADLERRVLTRTEELHRALAHEKELSEMKSNFVSLVSHEFRTPLGVIMSAVEVLQRYFERLPADKRARHLEMIFRSTKNLANLIEEVLLLGRVEEGRMQFSPAPLDLEKLCRTLTDELLSATGGACPIRFRALSSLEGAVTDETVLRHILCNLLSNAVKYSEPGSPVEFTAARHQTHAVFTIRDRGIGIPTDDQPKLFTSFTRGRNVGTRPGTGLGLVVVQRCVQLHGGTIALDSAPGAGTTVIVSLPVFSLLTTSIAPSS
jgi:signal transduction histidine kinase